MPDAAVCIGLTEYPQLSRLDGAIRDADAFHQWCTDPLGGNVDPSHATLLTLPGIGGRPPCENLSVVQGAMLPWVERCVRSRKVGRRLFLFFAGHGVSDVFNNNVAALVDPQSTPLATIAMDVRRYFQWFQASGSFEEIVFIFDCCRVLDPTMVPPPPSLPALTGRKQTEQVFEAYGGPYGDVAREQDFGAQGRHGYLTRALLDGLAGAAKYRDDPQDPRLDGESLRRYVYNRVDDFRNRWPDAPKVKVAHDPYYPVYFGSPQQVLHRVRITLQSAAAVQLDGQGTLHAATVVEAGPPARHEFEVPSGFYTVVVGGSRGQPISVTGALDVTL